MSEYDDTMTVNDLDTATPLDNASASEVMQAIRQMKAVLKNVVLTSLTPQGALRTDEGGVVSSGNIANDSIVEAKIADDAVTTSKLADGSVITVTLADGSVTTAKIVDNAITVAKLADGSVTGVKIADNAIGADQLLASATDALRPVTSTTIRDGAVGDSKITAVGVDKLTGGTSGDFLYFNGTNWLPVALAGDLAYDTATNKFVVSSGLSVATIIDTKSTGVDGGGPASPAIWSERDLGSAQDSDNIMTFAGNTFSLIEGNYLFHAIVSAHHVGTHQTRLQKTAAVDSAVSTAVLGTSGESLDSTAHGDSISSLMGTFTVTSSADTYRIQHWTQNANSSDGFGVASDSGESEIYIKGWLTKLG